MLPSWAANSEKHLLASTLPPARSASATRPSHPASSSSSGEHSAQGTCSLRGVGDHRPRSGTPAGAATRSSGGRAVAVPGGGGSPLSATSAIGGTSTSVPGTHVYTSGLYFQEHPEGGEGLCEEAGGRSSRGDEDDGLCRPTAMSTSSSGNAAAAAMEGEGGAGPLASDGPGGGGGVWFPEIEWSLLSYSGTGSGAARHLGTGSGAACPLPCGSGASSMSRDDRRRGAKVAGAWGGHAVQPSYSSSMTSSSLASTYTMEFCDGL